MRLLTRSCVSLCALAAIFLISAPASVLAEDGRVVLIVEATLSGH
jgi:hypothetical protein